MGWIGARRERPGFDKADEEVSLLVGLEYASVGLTMPSEHRAHEVQVLLRHRLPPFLGKGFGGQAGSQTPRPRQPRIQCAKPRHDSREAAICWIRDNSSADWLR